MKPSPQQLAHDLTNRALNLLSRREYGKEELKIRLRQYTEDDVLINKVVEDLSARNLQSDARFCESFIYTKAPRLGRLQLRYQLQQKGIDADLIDDYLPQRNDENSRALAVLRKKFRQPETSLAMRQKYLKFLAYRGFDGDSAHAALDAFLQEADDNDSNFTNDD